MTRRTRWCLLVLLAVALAACRPETDPRAALEDAVAETADESFAFELRAEADPEALELLGEAAGDAAAFFADVRVLGVREPDGQMALDVELSEGQPVLQAMSLPTGQVLVRTGLGDLLGLGEVSPEQALGPQLDDLGATDGQREALVAGFSGEWIAIAGLDGVGEALGATTDGEAMDLPALLDHVEVVGDREVGDVRAVDVEVDLDAVLGPDPDQGSEQERAGPGPAPGTVRITDGVVTGLDLEVAEAAADGEPRDAETDGEAGGGEADGGPDDGEAGGVRLEADLTEHGEAETGQPPAVTTTIDADELEELLELLGGE